MVKKYIPKQGDICYMDFDPSMGHEQSGFRPCLVLSITFLLRKRIKKFRNTYSITWTGEKLSASQLTSLY